MKKLVVLVLLAIGFMFCLMLWESKSSNDLNEQITTEATIEAATEEASLPAEATEATPATPDEPEEVSVELREYFETPSEPQEDTEEVIVASEATTDLEAKEEASEDIYEEPTEDLTEEQISEEPIPEEPVQEQEVIGGELEYAGIFELTAYPWTGDPCANGNYPTVGYTVASNYFALGTVIYIEGMGEFVVEDRGAMADNVVDIYMEDYDTCIEFGRKQAGVYIVK